MAREQFEERIKIMLDEIRDETLPILLHKDDSYQDCRKKLDEAEQAYIQLDLTKEQREITDTYLSLLDESNMDYNTLSYLSGLYDSHKFPGITNNLTSKSVFELLQKYKK